MPEPFTVGSLFSGIGGLDLGLEWAGMTVRWQAETDPFACRVLAKHWPDVPNHGDVTTIDWSSVEPVDLICGGYPCQPFSHAGRRAGESDPRHLWPHFERALGVLRPRWALLENVPGHLSLGFGRVLSDLARLGYDTEWACLPAAALGAPHLRWRVFAVAYANGGALRDGGRRRPSEPAGRDLPPLAGDDGPARPVADADRERLEERAEPHGEPPGPGRRSPRRPDADGRRDAVADTGGERLDGRQGEQGGGRDSAERVEAGGDAGDGGGSRAAAVADASGPRPQGHRRERGLGEGGGTLAPGGSGDAGRAVADAEGVDGQRPERGRGGGGRPSPPAGDVGGSVADADRPAGGAAWGSGQAIFGPGAVERLGRRRSGERDPWAAEPDVGRVAHGVPNRVDRLRGIGNAVVPQVAEFVGALILEADRCLLR